MHTETCSQSNDVPIDDRLGRRLPRRYLVAISAVTVLLLLAACGGPAPQLFDLDGTWSSRLEVVASERDDVSVGTLVEGDIVCSTSGTTVTCGSAGGAAVSTGTRSGNTVTLTRIVTVDSETFTATTTFDLSSDAAFEGARVDEYDDGATVDWVIEGHR